jgi:hypothetical protein
MFVRLISLFSPLRRLSVSRMPVEPRIAYMQVLVRQAECEDYNRSSNRSIYDGRCQPRMPMLVEPLLYYANVAPPPSFVMLKAGTCALPTPWTTAFQFFYTCILKVPAGAASISSLTIACLSVYSRLLACMLQSTVISAYMKRYLLPKVTRGFR